MPSSKELESGSGRAGRRRRSCHRRRPRFFKPERAGRSGATAVKGLREATLAGYTYARPPRPSACGEERVDGAENRAKTEGEQEAGRVPAASRLRGDTPRRDGGIGRRACPEAHSAHDYGLTGQGNVGHHRPRRAVGGARFRRGAPPLGAANSGQGGVSRDPAEVAGGRHKRRLRRRRRRRRASRGVRGRGRADPGDVGDRARPR